MRAVLWVLALFALAVAVTLMARFDQGYVLFVYPPWRAEMSFTLALALAVASFALGYFAVRLLRLAVRLPADVRAWRRRRRSDKAEDDLSRAVAAYLAGRMDEARRLADSALRHEAAPLSALLAAHAALAAGDPQGAQTYIDGLQTEVGELAEARQALARKLAETVPTVMP